MSQLGNIDNGFNGYPLVNGARQTGALLQTDEWIFPQERPVTPGDRIRIAGIEGVFTVRGLTIEGSRCQLEFVEPIPGEQIVADNAALIRI